MLATRMIFLGITGLVWLLNGWALLQILNVVPAMPGTVLATLVANMVIVPIVMWSSYRTGQLTEEAFRSQQG